MAFIYHSWGQELDRRSIIEWDEKVMALTLTSTVQQRQTWDQKNPSFGGATSCGGAASLTTLSP